MTKASQRPIRAGDKMVRDMNIQDQGKVRLGDYAPVFRAGDKVIRDTATIDEGKVRLGDYAPVFRR
jgi:hypothetical protein